jgi:mRNA interferase RelE/StbE
MPEARKALTRMPRPVAERIFDKIELYGRAPEALANNVKQLKAGEGFRLRVGDWRVLFDEDEATIIVRAVRPRGSAYG